jgi:proline iminopeptidase
MKIIRSLVWIAALAALLYLAMLIFWPREYIVPAERVQTHFNHWKLETGSDIAYVFLQGDSSQKNQSTIIYLHGGPGAGITTREIETWKQIAGRGFDVYLYDQAGCGRSGRFENINDYTVERHRQDLKAIIAKTGAQKVILAGQSWGSILAVSFIAAHPELVEKLIITAPAPLQPANRSMESVPAPDSLKLRAPVFDYPRAKVREAPLRMKLNNYLLKKTGLRIVGDAEADNFAAWQTNELNRWMVCDSSKAVNAESTEGYYVSMMTSRSIARMNDDRTALSRLNIPVLVMKAQCDNQSWGYTAEYLQVFKNAEFVLIKDAGHNAFIEQPEDYVEAVVGF